jgi:hypothetical protein
LRFLIVSIWRRCSLRELRLDVSDLPCETPGRGERLGHFDFLEGDDAMGVGSWRQPVNGWVSIGAEVRFFGIPAIL